MNIFSHIILVYYFVSFTSAKTIITQQITSREETLVHLNKDNPCQGFIYNSSHFNNITQNRNSDFVIKLFKGNSPTTFISISQLNSINDYDNYAETQSALVVSASSKEIIINSFQRTYTNMIQIQFCDHHYAFKDYLYIVEEDEYILLQENIPITINKFYHLNEYTFEFASLHQGNLEYEIQINSKLRNKTKGKIDVFINDLYALPNYSTTCFLNFKHELALKKGDILYIRITNKDPLFLNNELSIMISEENNSIIVLEEEHFDERYITQQSSLYYAINISNYNHKDTGVILFYLSDEDVIDQNIMTAAYTKKAVGHLNRINVLKPIRKEDNEYTWEEDDGNTNGLFYYITFTKDIIDAAQLYIVLYFQFKAEWFKSFQFKVSHLKRNNILIKKDNMTVDLSITKPIPYYYHLLFDEKFNNQEYYIQSYSTLSSNQYSLIINKTIMRHFIYKGVIALNKNKSILIKVIAEKEQSISLKIVIALNKNLVFSIDNPNDLYKRIKEGMNCFENLFYYQSNSYSAIYNSENDYKESIREFEFFTVDSITSINKDFNDLNTEVASNNYKLIESQQLFDYNDNALILIQCKRRYSLFKQNMQLIVKDFSIKVQWDQPKYQHKTLYNIYLLKKNLLFNKQYSGNITNVINKVNPIISSLTNQTSHLLYPINRGQYSLFLISLTQLNNTIVIKSSNQLDVTIPSILPTGTTILMLMIASLLLLLIALLIKYYKSKPKNE